MTNGDAKAVRVRRGFGAALLDRFQHPAQVIVTAFGMTILIGSLLLSLPVATENGERTAAVDALFTATSAVCVTGLIAVDTPGHWSLFGEIVILLLFQIGGLGIMTLATLFAVLVSRRIGLRAQMVAREETKTLRGGDIRRVVRNVVVFSLVSELIVATVLSIRFATGSGEGYGMPPGKAVYHGIFHAVSAFNNAGFSLNSNSLMNYVDDPWVNVPVVLAIIVGGVGFPVVFELSRSWRRPGHWTVLTRITVWTTLVLLVLGTIAFAAVEWHNQATMGNLTDGDKVLAAFFQSVTSRTAGFNTIDISAMKPEGWFVTDLLMFIGGGSAGTAGGIKVTTFGMLAFVIWAELRGEKHVNIGHRRLAEPTQRRALSIALLGTGLVVTGTFALHTMNPEPLDKVLFEVVSAFGTVGLSTGITGDLTSAQKVLIIILMFAGRTGPLTLGSALALKERTRRYELPEERPTVG